MTKNTEGVKKIKQKTDLQKFVELYKSIGAKCKPVKDENGGYVIILDAYSGNRFNKDKFDGYAFFYTRIRFDCYGKFITQSFLE